MLASLVVLPALVALTAGQFIFPFGATLDTPEVAAAKNMHAMAHAQAAMRNAGYLFRARRDVTPKDTPEMEKTKNLLREKSAACACDGVAVGCDCGISGAKKDKRQLMNMMTVPSVMDFGYTAYTSPIVYRIRRDASQDDEESSRDKRQLLYSNYPYSNYYGNYGYASPYYSRSGLGYNAFFG